MAVEIVMPRLGWTMEEGSLVEWLKKDGDSVKQGEIVFTVESDKAVNEVESFENGILRIPPDSPHPGTLVPVGTLMAYLVQPGELAPFEQSASATPSASTSVSQAAPENAPARVEFERQVKSSNGKDLPSISPRARRIAGELGVDWRTLTGSGRTGRIVERDIRAVAARQPAAAASARFSPLARRVAEDLNVDLAALAASMPGKRIEKADVERAAATRITSGAVEAVASADSTPSKPKEDSRPVAVSAASVETRSSLSTIRRIIATKMSNSAHTTAPVTLTTETDATELVNLRKQLKKDAESTGRAVPTYTDLLAKLVAESLTEFPVLNSRLEGDEIVHSEAVHIGIAVDSDRGIVVPVIRDVQAKSLRQIAREAAALIARARAGSLTTDEMSRGTFTISNLGMYEIDAFTPIINLPECAILGVGRIIPKQVVINVETETVGIRQMVFLSLTFDHRVVDGAPAARFLQRVKQFVEHPHLGLL